MAKKPSSTIVTFLLDRSGSMAQIRDDTTKKPVTPIVDNIKL